MSPQVFLRLAQIIRGCYFFGGPILVLRTMLQYYENQVKENKIYGSRYDHAVNINSAQRIFS